MLDELFLPRRGQEFRTALKFFRYLNCYSRSILETEKPYKNATTAWPASWHAILPIFENLGFRGGINLL